MKNPQTIKNINRRRRKTKARKKIIGTKSRPRISVYRSLKHIYAQLIDDEKSSTLVSASDLELVEKKARPKKEKGKSKTSVSFEVGKLLAEKAKKKNIKRVIFDRGGFKYHGRIKSLADGAREGGLEF